METQDNLQEPEHQPALDERWYEELERIKGPASFEYVKPDKAGEDEQRQKFLDGEVENPTFTYSAIDIQDVEDKIKAFEALKEKIKSEKWYDVVEKSRTWKTNELTAELRNEAVKKAYILKINERIASLRMVICAKKASLQDTPEDEKANLLRRFSRYNAFISGLPDPKLFAFNLDSLRKTGDELSSSDNPAIAEAAKDFLAYLPSHNIEYEEPAQPEQVTVDAVQAQTLREIGHIIDLPPRPDEKKYTAEEIKKIFENIFTTLNATGWTAVIEKQPNFNVSQEKRQIKIPEGKETTKKRLQELIAHEIGTHLLRRLNGNRSRLKLLGSGLDRYDQGDEGVATMREQSLQGKVEQKEWLGHLAVGLAIGTDGKKRNFQEVFEILQKYQYMMALKAGEPPAKAKETADKKAWNRCVRTFRGTDCRTRGVCFTKDIAYVKGNIAVWDIVGKNPEELLRLSIGKYDPANPNHIWVLTQLGITDKDLEELQK